MDLIVNMFLTCLFLQIALFSNGQVKILFDASKAETAGNADWVIDADNQNLFWSSTGVNTCTPTGTSNCHQSNAQKIPTPSSTGITASSPESFWKGGLSYWGLDCVRQGYQVESLPYNGSISFGNLSNPQDLSNYKIFVVCEPNVRFTSSEKTAILNFVAAGGSLFMIADHNISDRNGDGWDAPNIWNDLMQSNSTGNSNPFGIIYDLVDISETSTKLATNLSLTDSIVRGSFGQVSKIMLSGGTTMTINPSVNSKVKAIIYKNSVAGSTGNNNVIYATSRYGRGRIVAVGDSSPLDDGTGDTQDVLYNGYTGDAPPNHRNIIMNSTIWLASNELPCDTTHWTGVAGKAWENPYNWSCGTLPGSNTIVYIDSGKSNYPELTSNVAIRKLFTMPGASVKVNTGFKIELLGP